MSDYLIPLAAIVFMGLCLYLAIMLVAGDAPILPPIQT